MGYIYKCAYRRRCPALLSLYRMPTVLRRAAWSLSRTAYCPPAAQPLHVAGWYGWFWFLLPFFYCIVQEVVKNQQEPFRAFIYTWSCPYQPGCRFQYFREMRAGIHGQWKAVLLSTQNSAEVSASPAAAARAPAFISPSTFETKAISVVA